MSVSIFGRTPLSYGGAFVADAAVITFTDIGGTAGITGAVGLLAQKLSLNYVQEVARIYDLGSRNVYYIVGRSYGEGQMDRVLGPRPIQLGFYHTYGNPCAANNSLIFTVAQGCSPGDSTAAATAVSFTASNILLTSLGFMVQADNMVINEGLKFLFIDLSTPA